MIAQLDTGPARGMWPGLGTLVRLLFATAGALLLAMGSLGAAHAYDLCTVAHVSQALAPVEETSAYAYDGAARSAQANNGARADPGSSVDAQATSRSVANSAGAQSRSADFSVAANTETTALFRSVGADEAADIAATGTFNNVSGISVKYFATSADDAAAWGNWLNAGESTVVTTRVQTAVLDGAQSWARLDGIGPAFALDAGQLANLNRAMSGITVVP